MTGTPWARKPQRSPGEAPLLIHDLIEAAPAGARVLDAGCGPGSWRYEQRPDLEVAAFDIKFPPGPPPRAPNAAIFRADLARLPLPDQRFDLTICHYVLEHVTNFEPCCDELARVTRRGGALYLAVPRSASFDDRLYRFAGWFAKYVLLKLRKRLEHQQRFDLERLLTAFAARGFEVESWARVPAGFSWMNDPRTKPLQGPFTATLAALHRATGLDLAADANFVLVFRKTADPGPGSGGAPGRAADPRRLPAPRRITHVCRECGEHAVLEPPAPWPKSWTCPWCGKPNPFGRPR